MAEAPKISVRRRPEELRVARPSLVRTVVVALLLAAAWFGLGWLFAGVSWGVGLAAWSLVVGPVLVPIAVSLWARRRVGLRRLNLAAEWSVASSYFECLLKYPGLQPEVWVFTSRDPIVIWIEPLALGGTRVYVSQAWLKLESRRKGAEWTRLWRELALVGAYGRRVRTLQMFLWMGALSPVAVLLRALAFCCRVVGFEDLPTPAFWFQRAAWALRELWMSLPQGIAEFTLPRRGTLQPPGIWNSLLLGPWAQLSTAAECHPTWRILVHRSAFLEL